MTTQVYINPILISQTTTLKFRYVLPTGEIGPVEEAMYLLSTSALVSVPGALRLISSGTVAVSAKKTVSVTVPSTLKAIVSGIPAVTVGGNKTLVVPTGALNVITNGAVIVTTARSVGIAIPTQPAVIISTGTVASGATVVGNALVVIQGDLIGITSGAVSVHGNQVAGGRIRDADGNEIKTWFWNGSDIQQYTFIQ